ncbi:MAG: helix-turn-helix domain-containing protein [Armatimonadota bacterium]|nr:helix-turn-helix domain-containing protein [Armatimonadota bacterium]
MEETEVFVGSGNVFADLGLPNPEERQLKAQLIMEMEDAIRSKRLTKKQAAQKLGLDQSSLSELLEGALSQYSVDQFIQYLHCLGHDVELSAFVSPCAPEPKEQTSKKERDVVAA